MPLDQEKIFNNQIIEIIMIYKEKIAVYIRYSTQNQTEMQQMHTINEYLSVKNQVADIIVSDEGVSGGRSYKDRKLYDLICELSAGDRIVVSEVSRLGRSMSDLNKLVNDELKPRGLKLSVIKMGLELDCANIKAIDEMILNQFSFAAQLEKELIQDRVQAALDARKAKGVEIGGTNQLWGKNSNMTDMEREQYRHDVNCRAAKVSGERARQKAKSNPNNVAFIHFIEDYVLIHGQIDFKTTDWNGMVLTLNKRGLKTASGMEFDVPRAKAMYQKYSNQNNAN